MKKFCIYTAFISGLVFSSCNNIRISTVSPNEDKGVKEIYAFYGGQLKYSIKNTASTKDGVKKYFELEISHSNVVSGYKEHPGMLGSGIAYMFFKNLKEEKNKYDEIHTIIHIDDHEKYDYSYTKEELSIVDKKMKLVDRLVELLKQRNYDSIRAKLNPDTSIFKIDYVTYFKGFEDNEKQFGAVEAFNPLGFLFYYPNKNSTITMLHIAGILERVKMNNQFSVEMDPSLDKDEAMLIRYTLFLE